MDSFQCEVVFSKLRKKSFVLFVIACRSHSQCSLPISKKVHSKLFRYASCDQQLIKSDFQQVFHEIVNSIVLFLIVIFSCREKTRYD